MPSVFRPLDSSGEAATDQVSFEFDGVAMRCPVGTSVAAAILSNSDSAFRRTPVSGGARAAFCMMGACYDCLVEVDGEPNQQACMVTVRDGMCVRPMLGAAAFDEASA